MLRKLFGGWRRRPDEGPESPPGTPGSVPTGHKSAGSPTASLTLADFPPGPRHAYFEYVGGNSSKFYAVSLEEEDGGTWRVRFNFGRIGSPRQWDARVEGAAWPNAADTYLALISEKQGKGYEIRPWPAALRLPDGSTLEGGPGDGTAEPEPVLFRAATRGSLPPGTGATIAGISLPDGTLYVPTPEGGSRGAHPVIWGSLTPVTDLGQVWARLAAVFPDTGLWPFTIDATYGFTGFGDYLMDVPRGRHTEVLAILRKEWNGLVGYDEDYALEEVAPFGKPFPGLADPTPGDRATSVDHVVATLAGHLGLVAVNRPADILDAVGWAGAVNYDGDPLDMSTVLRSWEVRFDAYAVGMGTDTLTLAVGRPPRDLRSATAIAAEHFAFCPDNIQQGAGSVREYAKLLVDEELWQFWWD